MPLQALPRSNGDVLMENLEEILLKDSEYQKLCREALKWMETRIRCEIGTSRKKITTVNARWATACEARDRKLKEIEESYKRMCENAFYTLRSQLDK